MLGSRLLAALLLLLSLPGLVDPYPGVFPGTRGPVYGSSVHGEPVIHVVYRGGVVDGVLGQGYAAAAARGLVELLWLDGRRGARIPGQILYMAVHGGYVWVAWALGTDTLGFTKLGPGGVLYNVTVSTGSLVAADVSGVVVDGDSDTYTVNLVSLSSLRRYYALVEVADGSAELRGPWMIDGYVYNSSIWRTSLHGYIALIDPAALVYDEAEGETRVFFGTEAAAAGEPVDALAVNETALLAALHSGGSLNIILFTHGSGVAGVLELPWSFSGNTFSHLEAGNGSIYAVYTGPDGCFIRAYRLDRFTWIKDVYIEGVDGDTVRMISDMDGDGLGEILYRGGRVYRVLYTLDGSMEDGAGGYSPRVPAAGVSAYNGSTYIMVIDDTPAGSHVLVERLEPGPGDSTPPLVSGGTEGVVVGDRLLLSYSAVDNESLIVYMEAVVEGGGETYRLGSPGPSLSAVLDVGNGNYTVNVTAYNSMGLASSRVFHVSYLREPPRIVIEHPRPRGFVRDTVELVVESNSPLPMRASVSVNGSEALHALLRMGSNTIVLDVSRLPDGPLNISVEAVCVAGYASAHILVYKDASPPRTIILSPAEGDVLRGAATVTVEVADKWLSQAILYVDDEAYWSTTRPGRYNITLYTYLYPNGPHVLRLEALDRAGNNASASITVFINNTGSAEPSIRIMSGGNGTVFTGPGVIRIMFNNTVYAEIYIDGVLLTVLDHPSTYNYTVAAPPGVEHVFTVTVKAYGEGGARVEEEFTYIVDTRPPRITLALLNPPATVYGNATYIVAEGNETLARLMIGVEDGFIDEWVLLADGEILDQGSRGFSGLEKILLGPGVHNITLYARDIAGHASSKTLFIGVDPYPPRVDIRVEENGSRAIIRVEAWDELPISMVTVTVYRGNTTVFNETYYPGTSVFSANITVEGAGVYGVIATASDTAYNVGGDADVFALAEITGPAPGGSGNNTGGNETSGPGRGGTGAGGDSLLMAAALALLAVTIILLVYRLRSLAR